MSSRHLDIQFVRFVEFSTTCVFLYLAWVVDFSDFAGARDRSEISLINFVLLLAVVPFFIAFIMSFRNGLTESRWLLIRTTHQALAIVTIAIAAILLVGLPDTASATICVTVLAVLQLAALKASRKFAFGPLQAQRWPIRALRVAMVFWFAFVFLLMK